jgi:hypothetical protein
MAPISSLLRFFLALVFEVRGAHVLGDWFELRPGAHSFHNIIGAETLARRGGCG